MERGIGFASKHRLQDILGWPSYLYRECIQDVESQRPLLIWWSSDSCTHNHYSIPYAYIGSILLVPTQRGLPEVTLDSYLQSIHQSMWCKDHGLHMVQGLNDTWHLQRQLDISRAASMKGLRVLDLMYQDNTLAEDTSPKQMPTTCSNDLNNPHCTSKSYISRLVLFMQASNSLKREMNTRQNYFTSSDPHHDMLGGGCQVRVVIENMMGRMENLRTLISGFLGLVILVRWALVTMFLSWTTQTGCRIHRTYVSLIGSGEGRHTTHLLKCVPLLSTSQTEWKQSSDVLSDISFDILSNISSDIFFWYIFWHSFWHIFWHSFWHLSDISFDILSDKSFDTLSDISSDISFDMLSDISSDILSDISKPKPNIHSFTQKAALQTLYLPHTTQQK